MDVECRLKLEPAYDVDLITARAKKPYGEIAKEESDMTDAHINSNKDAYGAENLFEFNTLRGEEPLPPKRVTKDDTPSRAMDAHFSPSSDNVDNLILHGDIEEPYTKQTSTKWTKRYC